MSKTSKLSIPPQTADEIDTIDNFLQYANELNEKKLKTISFRPPHRRGRWEIGMIESCKQKRKALKYLIALNCSRRPSEID